VPAKAGTQTPQNLSSAAGYGSRVSPSRVNALMARPGRQLFKPSREIDEALDRDFLRARGRLDAGCLQQCEPIDAERLETLPQHLAALAERRLCHSLQRARSACE